MIKKKYPVYYALNVMKDTANMEVMGFIVSKCYLLESNIKYLPTGGTYMIHRVVFPYQEQDCFGNIKLERRLPVDCNASTISSIFETYEDAKEACFIRNSEFSAYQQLKLSALENQVLEATEDLMITQEAPCIVAKSLHKSL